MWCVFCSRRLLHSCAQVASKHRQMQDIISRRCAKVEHAHLQNATCESLARNACCWEPLGHCGWGLGRKMSRRICLDAWRACATVQQTRVQSRDENPGARATRALNYSRRPQSFAWVLVRDSEAFGRHDVVPGSHACLAKGCEADGAANEAEIGHLLMESCVAHRSVALQLPPVQDHWRLVRSLRSRSWKPRAKKVQVL